MPDPRNTIGCTVILECMMYDEITIEDRFPLKDKTLPFPQARDYLF